MNQITFRPAQPRDMALLLRFITELADYEKLAHEVVATEELLCQWIFQKHRAEVIFAMAEGREVGYALYFYNFSTFLGRAGIYLEDLCILPAERGKGYGKQLLRRLAQIAAEEGCGRLEWSCLDWNQPSIAFYRSIGAEVMEGWSAYRLTGDTLRSFANPE